MREGFEGRRFVGQEVDIEKVLLLGDGIFLLGGGEAGFDAGGIGIGVEVFLEFVDGLAERLDAVVRRDAEVQEFGAVLGGPGRQGQRQQGQGLAGDGLVSFLAPAAGGQRGDQGDEEDKGVVKNYLKTCGPAALGRGSWEKPHSRGRLCHIGRPPMF